MKVTYPYSPLIQILTGKNCHRFLICLWSSELSTRCHCNQSSRRWRINNQVVFNLVNVIVSDDSDVVGSKVGIAPLCQDQISGVNVEGLGQDTEVEDQVLKTGNAIGDVK